MALDQYEVTRRRSAAFNEFVRDMRTAGVVVIEVRDEEDASEDDALVVPPSWAVGPNERWKDLDVDSAGPVLEEPLNSITVLTELVERRRNCASLITVSSADARKLQVLVDRVWTGMRPHPYSANQIARCITATIRWNLTMRHVNLSDGLEQGRIAEEQLGPAVEIEMSTSGENAARAFVSLSALWFALKKDVRLRFGQVFEPHGRWLAEVLDENWNRPGRNFDGAQLIELFVDHIIPWQVATGRDPVAFSAFHVLTLGRP